MYKSSVFRLLFVLLSLFSVRKATAQADSTRTLHVGFVYPLSTAGTQARYFTNRFSLHAISGVSRAEAGVALYGVAGLIKNSANGILVAGVANLVGGSAHGVQVAGITNFTKHKAAGFQAAGIVNLAESSSGVQVSGVGNLNQQDASGLQVAGVINTARTTNNQIAGLINIAKSVKGVQIAGLINIADSSDYPIGLINIIKNGEKSISVSIDETLTSMVSFRSGGRILYGIVGLGYNFRKSDEPVYGIESGLGANIHLSDRFRINTEVLTQQLSDFKKGEYAKYSVRILPAVRLGKIGIFAGPSANYVRYTKDKGVGFTKRFLWTDTTRGAFNGLFVGWVAGVRYHI